MTIEDIIGELFTFREEQLLRINSAVISELKAQRRRESQRKRFLFQSGDRVTWTGRKGTFEGIVERVEQCLQHAPAERLSFAPDCGLRQTARWAAKQKLENMVAGVHEVREKLGWP